MIDVGRPWEFLELNEHYLEVSESIIEGEIEEELLFMDRSFGKRAASFVQAPILWVLFYWSQL